MSTNFHAYVSHGSREKLESYCKCKSPGTVIIYKYTVGEQSGTVIIAQVTKSQTLESARTVVLTQSSQRSILNNIKLINYRRK